MAGDDPYMEGLDVCYQCLAQLQATIEVHKMYPAFPPMHASVVERRSRLECPSLTFTLPAPETSAHSRTSDVRMLLASGAEGVVRVQRQRGGPIP
jgi:hypothetical protein